MRIFTLALQVIYWIFGAKKQLSVSEKRAFAKQWNTVKTLQEPVATILEAEKVFVSVLKALGYHGTFAEQWSKAERRFGKRTYIWKAHRLRNRIVHEPNTRASTQDAQFVVQSYNKVLNRLFT
jgi:hypothetical protein